jgi:predicted 2-oxoglutarate/Fe(II)-dependent dioxygenase YbiX
VDIKSEEPIVIRNALTPELIDHSFKLWQNSALQFTDDTGQLRDRVSASTVGHFIVSYWTQKEFQPLLDHLQPIIDKHISNPMFNDFRILKYSSQCFIPKHLDGSYSANNNTHNLIIQMSEPDNYKGGKVIVNDTEYKLEPGDALVYDFKVLHEVRPIKQGLRYVMNLRFHSTV